MTADIVESLEARLLRAKGYSSHVQIPVEFCAEVVAEIRRLRAEAAEADSELKSAERRAAALETALTEIAGAHCGKCPFDGDYSPGLLVPCRVCGDIDDTELPEGDPRKGKPSQCHQGGASARARDALAGAKESTSPRWRHVKRGTTYTELGRGKLQCAEVLGDDEPVVIYRADSDGALWVRGADEFEDGRFVPADKESTDGNE